jgi:glycerol-3-phosphate dehydrogenase
MSSFSAHNRTQIINKLTTTHYDVIVIGGGITGAGIALDASARGLKVAVLEMQDFAAGTSSRSTKLIHGGLRYLKQLEFKLVAEVGKERAIVHRNAPHLAIPQLMLLPIVKGGELGVWSARLGMWVYEKLAGVKQEEWHTVLSKNETLAAEPMLRADNLLGGISFYEYRTDDARLTIEVLKQAVNTDAIALNYSKVIGFEYTQGKVSGVKVQDIFTNETYTVKGNYVVNSSGPWVDVLDKLDDIRMKQAPRKLHITKGVHLVIDAQRLPVKQALYFDTPDKRMIFIIPREGKTYIGTTDTFYSDDIAHPQITHEEQTYLLSCVNNIFPTLKLIDADVESTWAGLRPLIRKEGKGPSEISRKDEMFVSARGLITIAGGKLTGYRKMAQRVVDLIATQIKTNTAVTLAECTTQDIALAGTVVTDKFDTVVQTKTQQGVALGLTAAEAHQLIYRYGTNVDALFTIVRDLNTHPTTPLPIALQAQLMYCIANEMCSTPTDFFIRRTGAIYFDIASVAKYATPVINYMQTVFNWNEPQTLHFTAELNTEVARTKASS